MAVTANGWPTLTRFTGVKFVACGEGRAHDIVSRDLAVIASAFTYDFHTRVESVETCFGGRTLAQQRATNPLALDSNHCSSTAWDLNGGKHPYEAAQRGPWRSGFNAAQVNTIRALLAYYEVLQWGGDFTSPYRDAMHWQIAQANPGGNGPRVVSEADVARVARKVAAFWTRVQRTVGVKADGFAGPGTLAAVKAWQASKGLVADGIFGSMSQAVAGWNVDVPVVHGVDVSEHQTVKDWRKVSPDLLVAKATEGLSYVDPRYTEHATAARKAGIFHGAYHFVWLGFDPAKSCQHFLSTAQLGKGERGIIDFEPYGKFAGDVPERDWPAWVVAFIDEYRRQRGEHPDIYLNDDMAARLMRHATKTQAKVIRSCGLWKARYDSTPGDSHGWDGIVGWQYSGDVIDRNVFYGKPAQPGGGGRKPEPQGDPKVRRIQRIVGAKRDGIYGPKTAAAVRAFQRRLNRFRHAGLKVDGIYGPATERARRAFCDGILGPDTISLWQHNAGTPVDGVISRPSTLIRKVQRMDSRQASVRDRYKLTGDEIDGLLGPKTWRMLQDLMGIKVDGIPGPVTIRHLQGRLLRGDW